MIPGWVVPAIGAFTVSAALVVAGCVGHFIGWSEARAQCAAQQDEARATLQKRYDTVSSNYERLKKQRQAASKVVIKEIEREVLEKPVYRECRVPADGVRLLNDARRGVASGGAGEPDGALPWDPVAP